MEKNTQIIRVENLKTDAIVGVYQYEKEVKQPIILDIEIEIYSSDAIKSDRLENTLDYHKLTEEILNFIDNSKFELLERLANEIHKIISNNIIVIEAKVKIRKPKALSVYGDVMASVECNSS